MSTSKNINKICWAIVAVTLVLTLLFMNGKYLGITVTKQEVKYASTIFDTSYVHQIDIVMNDWDEFIEDCEDEEYASCTVVVDGNKYSNTAIRAKGNTSLSSVSSSGSDRYSFKLEFDHYEDGKTMDGLDKLCLNNMIQDNTLMKDYIAYQMMLDFGVDAPLCSFAYITVNGEDWGLYLAVEAVEDGFMTRNYGGETGELYKPDSMSFGGGRGNGKDFNINDLDFENMDFGDMDFSNFGSSFPSGSSESSDVSSDGITTPEGTTERGNDSDSNVIVPSMPGEMTLPEGMTIPDMSDIQDITDKMGDMSQEMGIGMGSSDVMLQYIDDDPDSYSNIFDNAKTDITETDQERLIESLKKLSNYEDLESVVDTDEVMRYFVIHNFLCNGDSYTGSMVHNYYLYEEDGQLSMIPWDYNLAYGTFQGGAASSTVNTSIDSPSTNAVDDLPMLGWIFSDESYTKQYHELFAEFIDEWFSTGKLETLINDTSDMIRSYVEKDPTKFCTTKEFEAGVIAMKEFVSLRAEAVRNQLAGDNTAVDTGDLNLSDMGTMNNTVIGGMEGSDIGGGTVPMQPDSGGTVPMQPDSDGSEEMPTMPIGDGSTEMPTMPIGDGSTEMPTMPGNDRSKETTSEAEKTTASDSDAIGEIGDNTEESTGSAGADKSIGVETFNKADMGNVDMSDFDSHAVNSEITSWILVGVSVLALVIGLIIAWKKKY